MGTSAHINNNDDHRSRCMHPDVCHQNDMDPHSVAPELSSLQRQPSLKFMLQKDSITENATPATTKYPKDHPTHNAHTTLQHLPLSPGINPCIPGRLVAGDTNPGRHVARDSLKGKARRGFFPGRDIPATLSDQHSFSQRVKCHGGGFSRATCRPGLCCY
ncbi:hypothetical protein Tco_0965916 [Tanacetum coccineum]